MEECNKTANVKLKLTLIAKRSSPFLFFLESQLSDDVIVKLNIGQLGICIENFDANIQIAEKSLQSLSLHFGLLTFPRGTPN